MLYISLGIRGLLRNRGSIGGAIMISINHSSIRFLSILLITVLTSGCGGSDSSLNPQAPPSSTDILNPDLSGKLLLMGGAAWLTPGAWTMDMATGKYIPIPKTNWEHDDYDEQFSFINRSYIDITSPGYDSSSFLVVVSSSLVDLNGTTVIVKQSMNGDYLDKFVVLRGSVNRPVKMSPDGQYVALFRVLDPLRDTRFEIYDWSGALVSSKKMSNRHFSWLPPDGHLVYTEWRSLHFTAPNSVESERYLTLPDDFPEGWIGEFSISPDGTRLVFSLVTERGGVFSEYTNAEPYIMNIDGTGLRKLATTPHAGTVESKINNPKWSPDGRWILVETDRYTSTTPPSGATPDTFPGDPGTVYVLPSEDMGKVFMLSLFDSLRSPEVRLLYRFNEENLYEEGLYDSTPITRAGKFISRSSWIQ